MANPSSDATYILAEASEATHLQGYTITLANDNKSYKRLPKTWTLYGSNDQETWVIINQQADDNWLEEDYENYKSYTYFCNTSTAYKYFKFSVTDKDSNDGCFQISELKLIPSAVGFSYTDSNASNTGSRPNAMDGKTGTKLEGNSNPTTLTVTATSAAKITGFLFTTGNDTQSNSGRNPRSIKVEGSNDGETWSTISLRTGYTGLQAKNYYPCLLQCYGDAAYSQYRFTFDEIPSRYIQMAEIAIITEQTETHSYSSEGFCTKCLSPEAPATDASSVYQITNAGKFVSFASMVNAGRNTIKGKITTDIDLSEVSWTPIGNTSYPYKALFDGQYKTVTLNMTNTSADYQGLFGVVTGGVDIQNILTKGVVKGNNYVGAIAGGSNAGGFVYIRHCGNEADVTTSGANGAGIFGCNMSGGARLELWQCYNAGTVNSHHEGGALSGWVGSNNLVQECFNIGVAKNTENNADADFFRNGGGTHTNNYDYRNGEVAVSSGELCYKLPSSIFGQAIGTDAHPVFQGPKVYETVTSGINKYYANSESNFTLSSMTLTDTEDFSATGNFTATSLAYNRMLEAGGYHSLCLPFAIKKSDLPSGSKLFTLSAVGTDAVTLNEVDEEVAAGTPCFASVTSDFNFGTMSNVAMVKDVDNSGTVKGTFTNNDALGAGFYKLSSDGTYFGLTTDGATATAFRSYIAAPAGVKTLNILLSDGTSITTALSEEQPKVIYDLSGRRVEKATKGLYIINGKKVMK